MLDSRWITTCLDSLFSTGGAQAAGLGNKQLVAFVELTLNKVPIVVAHLILTITCEGDKVSPVSQLPEVRTALT